MRLVFLFRWAAFLIAGITLVSVFVLSPYRPVGGPFRFFEVWVLMISFFSMGRMMAILERRSTREWPVLVASAAALNISVIVLFLAGFIGLDEARQALPLPSVLVLTLYVIAPALQCIDALFIHSNVRNFLGAAIFLGTVMGVYLLWIECVVQRVSNQPFGDETDGLPYWSLNDLALYDRVFLYGGVAALALAALAAISGLHRIFRKVDGNR